MRRRLIAVLSMVALALGIAIAGPANVAAAASGCSFYKGGTMVQVKCSGGSGHYQAIAVCKKAYWNPLAPETKVS